MHAARTLALPLAALLLATLPGCAPSTPGAAAMPATTAASATIAPVAATATTSMPAATPGQAAVDADFAAATARDQRARADREQTLRVQQQLRAEQRAREAAQRADADVRCLGGQRMRRVANGWVQDGSC